MATAVPCFACWQVLTDYEALTRVFHNVQSSAVRTCAHTGAKQLVQTCKWAFLVFRWARVGWRGAGVQHGGCRGM